MQVLFPTFLDHPLYIVTLATDLMLGLVCNFVNHLQLMITEEGPARRIRPEWECLRGLHVCSIDVTEINFVQTRVLVRAHCRCGV